MRPISATMQWDESFIWTFHKALKYNPTAGCIQIHELLCCYGNKLKMEVEFVYQFTWKGKLHELKLPLKLPYEGNTKELASRLIAVHKIPYPLEQQLTADLERFVVRETQKHQDACADHVIQTSLHDEKVT